MTDNELIKELEQALRVANETINRQRAEIERLESHFRFLDVECGRLEKAESRHYDDIIKARAEAIKEFAERLKELMKYEAVIYDCHIDNLVKEMTDTNVP